MKIYFSVKNENARFFFHVAIRSNAFTISIYKYTCLGFVLFGFGSWGPLFNCKSPM